MKIETLSLYAASLVGLMSLMALSAAQAGAFVPVEPVRPGEALKGLLALAR